MQAAVYTQYGPPDVVVQIANVEKPVPKDALIWSWFISQKFVFFIAKLNKPDLALLSELMATGKVTPVIDRCYSLNQVPEAIRYLSEHHARGKVVITLQ